MEPIHYQPEGDPVDHLITAEVAAEDKYGVGVGFLFRIRSDGEEIGEVEVYSTTPETSFITAISSDEKISNGYLRPASMAIAAFFHEDDPRYKNTRLFDIDDELII